MNDDIFITSFARTPVATFNGAFAQVPATKLGSIAIAEALSRADISPECVDDVYMGNVLSAGLGQNPARQAAIGAGILASVGATTVNKVCGSGLQAIVLAYRSIRCGDSRVAAAGGMESMTCAPYLLDKARSGYRLGNSELLDSVMTDGLLDAYERKPMGVFAEAIVRELGISRGEQDDFAVQSNLRAIAATDNGVLAREVVPVEVTLKNEIVRISRDEQLGRFDEGKLRQLRPVFDENGTITAANASSLNDAAAVVIMMSGTECQQRSVKPIARILGFAHAGLEPARFTVAPIQAVAKLLSKLSLTVADIGLFEINEAFAMVVVAAMKQLSIPHSKVNVHGGAVALGHPIGASGARIVVALLNALLVTGERIGIATVCIGGGEAIAIALERADS